jgi:hypothetical protein
MAALLPKARIGWQQDLRIASSNWSCHCGRLGKILHIFGGYGMRSGAAILVGFGASQKSPT